MVDQFLNDRFWRSAPLESRDDADTGRMEADSSKLGVRWLAILVFLPPKGVKELEPDQGEHSRLFVRPLVALIDQLLQKRQQVGVNGLDQVILPLGPKRQFCRFHVHLFFQVEMRLAQANALPQGDFKAPMQDEGVLFLAVIKGVLELFRDGLPDDGNILVGHFCALPCAGALESKAVSDVVFNPATVNRLAHDFSEQLQLEDGCVSREPLSFRAVAVSFVKSPVEVIQAVLPANVLGVVNVDRVQVGAEHLPSAANTEQGGFVGVVVLHERLNPEFKLAAVVGRLGFAFFKGQFRLEGVSLVRLIFSANPKARGESARFPSRRFDPPVRRASALVFVSHKTVCPNVPTRAHSRQELDTQQRTATLSQLRMSSRGFKSHPFRHNKNGVSLQLCAQIVPRRGLASQDSKLLPHSFLGRFLSISKPDRVGIWFFSLCLFVPTP